MDRCPVCLSSSVRPLEAPRRPYFRCGRCSFAWVGPAGLPDEAAARERYLLHRNDPANGGYASFLSGVLARCEGAWGPSGPRTVADWGSGPEPAFSALLRSRGYDAFPWDPIFPSGEKPAPESCDAAVCVEVAEHFRAPREDFLALASRVKPGGWLCVHTSFVPSDDAAFASWWYKEDSTHVSFYSEEALRRLGYLAGLEPVAFESGRFAAFRRVLPVLVAGGSNWDAEGRPFKALAPRDSNPGTVRFSPGGAGRNIAEDLARLGVPTELVSAVGADGPGREIRRASAEAGVGTAGLLELAEETTSSYLAILDADGDMAWALSGMGLYERFGPGAALEACAAAEASARSRSFLRPGEAPFSALAADGNLLPETLEAVISRYPGVPAWLDPVSAAKGERFASYRGGALLARLSALKPNLVEAERMAAALAPEADSGAGAAEAGVGSGSAVPDRDRASRAAGVLRRAGAEAIYVSMGADGVLWADGGGEASFVPPPVRVVSATGAGDAFFAAALRASVLGLSGLDLARRACAAAALALASPKASSDLMNPAAAEDAAAEWSET